MGVGSAPSALTISKCENFKVTNKMNVLNPLKQSYEQVSFDMLLKQLVTKAGAFCKTRRCLQKAKDRALSKRIFVRIK